MKKELKDYIANIKDILRKQEEINDNIWRQENLSKEDNRYCLGKNTCIGSLSNLIYEIEDIEEEAELNGFLDLLKLMIEYVSTTLGK